jgi:hypothetical protein
MLWGSFLEKREKLPKKELKISPILRLKVCRWVLQKVIYGEYDTLKYLV